MIEAKGADRMLHGSLKSLPVCCHHLHCEHVLLFSIPEHLCRHKEQHSIIIHAVQELLLLEVSLGYLV